MLDRRSFLVASTAASVAAPAGVVAGSVANSFDELVAEYRLAKEAHNAAGDHAVKLTNAYRIPIPEIRFGRRRLTNQETGAVTFTKWRANYPNQIDAHFKPYLDLPYGGAKARSKTKSRKARLLRTLRAKWEAHERAEREAGITAAEEAEYLAWQKEERLRNAIYAYRPGNPREVAAKARFVLSQVSEAGLSQEQMAVVLRSLLPIST